MYLFICLVPIFFIDLTNFVFEIFENYYYQFDFAAVFEVNDTKHQNILPTKFLIIPYAFLIVSLGLPSLCIYATLFIFLH